MLASAADLLGLCEHPHGATDSQQPEWRKRLTAADWRGLTPLFFTHINPYGTFKLDMDKRLPIDPPRHGPGHETVQLHLYDEAAG